MQNRAVKESSRKKEKSKSYKVLNAVGYVTGSIALFAVACATVPNIIFNISGALYKASLKKASHDNDWGPVIERKVESGESEPSEQIDAKKEEDTDGD